MKVALNDPHHPGLSRGHPAKPYRGGFEPWGDREKGLLVDPFSTTLPVALLTSMRVRFNLTIAAASGFLVLVTAGLVLLLDRLVGLEKLIGTGIYRA